MLYDGCIRFLEQARSAIDSGDTAAPGTVHLGHVPVGATLVQHILLGDRVDSTADLVLEDGELALEILEGVVGIEVSWTPDHYEVQTGGLDAPPVHALKIKVVPVDGADPAAIMVIRATAERARILTGFERGRVEPGVSYVAVCARVSAAGASAYSTASEPAIAAAPAIAQPLLAAAVAAT